MFNEGWGSIWIDHTRDALCIILRDRQRRPMKFDVDGSLVPQDVAPGAVTKDTLTLGHEAYRLLLPALVEFAASLGITATGHKVASDVLRAEERHLNDMRRLVAHFTRCTLEGEPTK